MSRVSSICGLFEWRQFEPEVILLAIGWYRAVDSTGATLDFLLTATQDAEAAKRLLAKALSPAKPSRAADHPHRWTWGLRARDYAVRGVVNDNYFSQIVPSKQIQPPAARLKGSG